MDGWLVGWLDGLWDSIMKQVKCQQERPMCEGPGSVEERREESIEL